MRWRGDSQAGPDNAGVDLKSKALDFLDKLNPKPTDVVTEDSAIDEEEDRSTEVSNDVSLETEAVSEVIESESVDVVVETESVAAETAESQSFAESQSSAEAPSAEAPSVEISSVETSSVGIDESIEAVSETIEASVPDVEAPIEGEMSGGSEPPTDLQDHAVAVDSPMEDVPEETEAPLGAIAENQSPEIVEEAQSEDSNWPPEPTDYN